MRNINTVNHFLKFEELYISRASLQIVPEVATDISTREALQHCIPYPAIKFSAHESAQ